MRNFVVCVAVLGLVACSSGGNGDGSSSSSASSTSTGGNGNGNDSGGNGSGGGSGGSTTTGGSGSTGQVAAPTIDSFTATPNALPSQGGDVLLSWSVTGADTLILEPGYGDVTGLQGFTVHGLTASTTFRLIASNGGGRVVATTDVVLDSPLTLTGTVTDVAGNRAPNVAVYVPGHPPTATGLDGTFSVSGVVPPYDLVIADVNGGTVQIARALHSNNVTLPAIWLSSGSPTSPRFSAVVSGAISGHDLNATNTRVGFAAATGEVASGSGLGQFSLYANFDEDAGVRGTLSALDEQSLPDGGTSYLDFGQITDLVLTPDSAQNVVVQASPITTGYVTVQSNLPVPDGGQLEVNSALQVSGPTGISLSTASSRTASLVLPVPNLSGSSVDLSVSWEYQSCVSAQAGLVAAPGSTAAVDLLTAPLPISPVNDANGVDASTVFAWVPDGHAGTGYVTALFGESRPAIIVGGMTSQFTLPNLSALGVSLQREAGYSLQVIALPNVGTAEQVYPVLINTETATHPDALKLANCSSDFQTAP